MTRFARYNLESNRRKRKSVSSTEPVQKKPRNFVDGNIDSSKSCSSQEEYLKMVKQRIGQDDEEKSHKNLKDSNQSQSQSSTEFGEQSSTTTEFKENDHMTQYEGYWVRRSSVQHLTEIYRKKYDRLIEAREESSDDKTLTPQEKLTLNRLMKKEKRREHAILCKELKNGTANVGNSKFNSRYSKFDGFTVTKQGAEKLHLLRNELEHQGYSDDKIQEAMKRERRKEEKTYKKEKKQYCFKCRETGHTLASCPESTNSGICYKCGSDEHSSRSCSKVNKNSYAFATCFHCGKEGHLARECSTNPRGLYPNGGECLGCGSINHLIKDCPKPQKSKKDGIRAELRTNENIEELEFEESEEEEEEIKTVKRPVVKQVFF